MKRFICKHTREEVWREERESRELCAEKDYIWRKCLGERKGGKLELSVSLMLAHPSLEILGVLLNIARLFSFSSVYFETFVTRVLFPIHHICWCIFGGTWRPTVGWRMSRCGKHVSHLFALSIYFFALSLPFLIEIVNITVLKVK